jgi:hypothetical protein
VQHRGMLAPLPAEALAGWLEQISTIRRGPMFMVDGLLSCPCSWLRNRSLTRFGVEATAGQRMVEACNELPH